jgi:hypothetical protein
MQLLYFFSGAGAGAAGFSAGFSGAGAAFSGAGAAGFASSFGGAGLGGSGDGPQLASVKVAKNATAKKSTINFFIYCHLLPFICIRKQSKPQPSSIKY